MASSIVTSAAQKLGWLLVDEAKYLYHVSDKMKGLQAELEWMVCFLEDADNREHQEKIVCKWISEIRDIAYDAEDVVERYLHEVSHHRQNGVLNTVKWFSCCICDALALHFVGSSIDDLRARLSDLIPRMQMYGIRSVGRTEGSQNNTLMGDQRRTYSHTEEDPVGLDEHVKVVVGQLLENKDASVIGIVGMGGLGKTTLARSVFSDKAVKERFQNKCAWVYLSKEFDKRVIFKEILISLWDDEDKDIRKKAGELGDDELPRKIHEVMKAKECLIVVDDIWYTHSWDHLKPIFGSIKSTNSKILITTRNKNLVSHADDVGYSHSSDKLSDENSWELLKQKAFFERGMKVVATEVKAKMEKLGREMVEHCDGLPLAIITLGGILAAKKTVEEWEIVQKNISSYLMCDTVEENVTNGVSQVLDLSYYDLPFYLKPCFLYLGNFPEDYEIRSQRLYHLWEAEGLVSRANHKAEIEGVSLDNIAESYLNQLALRSMVEVCKRWPNGSIKSCRVHDIMRDMCLQKCKEVNFLSVVDCGNSNMPSGHAARSSPLRRCSLYLAAGSSWPTSRLQKSTNIRSLLVFPFGYGANSYESFKQLSQGMSKFSSQLRVLDLQETKIGGLPRAIKSFIHMRYLNLRGTGVVTIPQWVLHLACLETLDLRCGDFMYVYPDFQKLERLRHLYLPGRILKLKRSMKLKFSDDQLQQMETLKNFHSQACRIEDLAKMVNLKIFTFADKYDAVSREGLEALANSPVISSGRLINHFKMTTLEAEIINEKPTILKAISGYLKVLVIRGKVEVGVDVSGAKIFHHNLKGVVLDGCEIGEIHLTELEKLPHLESLRLQSRAVKGSKMSFSKKAFPRLFELCLYRMEELQEWEVEEGAIPNLCRLEIYGCRKLRKLPHHLPSAVKITCGRPCIPGIENYNTCKFRNKNPSNLCATEENVSLSALDAS